MSKTIVEIEILQAGQPRPYADSMYEAYVSCRLDGIYTYGRPVYRILTEHEVKQLAKLFVHSVVLPDEAGWWEPQLKLCAAVGPTPDMIAESKDPGRPMPQEVRWHIQIVQQYTD